MLVAMPKTILKVLQHLTKALVPAEDYAHKPLRRQSCMGTFLPHPERVSSMPLLLLRWRLELMMCV